MSREEFCELISYISELKHQYNRKIDEQTTKINDQSVVMEELLWQLRELSDKVRKLNDKVRSMECGAEKFRMPNSCICRYENHIPKNRILNEAISAEDKNISNDEELYETIEFSDSSNLYTEPVKPIYDKETTTPSPAKISVSKNSKTDINGNVKHSTGMGNSLKKKGYRERREYLNTILSTDEEDEDKFLRSKPIKQFSANRGSSKALCSLVSDIEVEFIPQVQICRKIVSDISSMDYLPTQKQGVDKYTSF